MGLRPAQGNGALPLAARAGGTFTSGPVAPAGAAGDVVLLVHCTAVSGTTPTLDVKLETSPDGETWTSLTGSGITQLTAAGNRTAYAKANARYVRVTSTVGGTTPSVTYRVALLIF